MVREENKKHRPELQEYHHGVLAPMPQCISLTLSERLQVLDLSGLDPSSMNISFSFCWGMDGSGDHSNYQQLTKSDYTTKQVMSCCFAIKEVKVRDSLGQVVNWSSSVDGANRPQNTRPLALFPEQESSALMQEFVPLVEKDVKDITGEGVEVKLKAGSVVKAHCEEAKLSMADGKMVSMLLNLNGAYCTMCTRSQAECQKEEIIEGGFMIDRSVESIGQLALSLTDPETGEVIRKRSDYRERQGVCGQPITESDLTKNIPVCHSKIRVTEFTMELVYRENSHKKWYTPTNGISYTKEDKELYNSTRERVKEAMKVGLAVNVGNPGDMVQGNAFKKFSSDFGRNFISNMISEDKREQFSEILLGLFTLVKVINSQKRKVDVDKVRKLGQQVYLQLVQLFPWVVITPSVHRILAHSWEVMLLNDSFGLGNQSEEGLEAIIDTIFKMYNISHFLTKNENVWRDSK